MRDVLSVNEKYQNGCFDRRGAGEQAGTPPKTPTLGLCKVFSPASGESSGSDKSNGVVAGARGDGPASCFFS